ncbi:AIR carboxylase family protein, partial [Salmonella enterica]|uniref:AIR carboxylase family protein n=1 Tax=Salmonella enterica TaxID=28901 RepID=UPI001910570A
VEAVSAHRTPDKLFSLAETAEENGHQVIIACAGGAPHLPGMTAAQTLGPALRAPAQSAAPSGVASLHSTPHMPRGIPAGTLPIGKARDAKAAPRGGQIPAPHAP